MKALFYALGLLSLVGAGAARATDNPEAEERGQELAAKLLAQQPAGNITNHGVLKIRDGDGHRSEFSLRVEILVTPTNWVTTYTTLAGVTETLVIVHAARQPNQYTCQQAGAPPVPLTGRATETPLAGSDFWAADLGLEFLHWPGQKWLRQEIKRSQGCQVLESTNPDPSANGYTRVVSWIDTENGGLVQAWAYNTDGRLFKEFYPKDLKKIKGEWRVGQMEMSNDLTGSRTRIEFDLAAADSPQK